MKKGDLNVNIKNNILTVSAEKHKEEHIKSSGTIRKESFYERVERSIQVPTQNHIHCEKL